MQAFLAFFIGSSLRAIVFRIMAMLGIGALSFTGSQVVIDSLISLFIDYANQLPPEWLSLIGFLYADRALSLIASAVAVKISIKSARKVIGFRGQGAS